MAVVTKTKHVRIKGDLVIPILIVLLALFSILMVYSVDGKRVTSHLFHIFFALGGMSVGYLINYKKLLNNFAFFGLVIAVILLLATLASSAVRAISIFGRDFQTFYLIGFLVIIYLSNYIGRRLDNGQDRLTSQEENFAMGILFLFCLGIAMLNMSTAIILFATGMAMFYVGGFRFKKIFIVLGLVVAVLLSISLLVYSGKLNFDNSRLGRFGTFVHRWEYYFTKDNTKGYGDQMILSRAAIARSGLHPAGPGKGVIKNRLPEKTTDYAFASLYEEMGILAGFIILAIYCILLYRSWVIARESKSSVGSLVAFSLGFWMTFQAFVHIGVNCELLPSTGQTLPFISTSGASLLVSGFAMGMVMNVSKINAREALKSDPRTLYVQGSTRDS